MILETVVVIIIIVAQWYGIILRSQTKHYLRTISLVYEDDVTGNNVESYVYIEPFFKRLPEI